jgi:uncharacterized protein
LEVKRNIQELSILFGKNITPSTLLIFDEIQTYPRAIMELRYFYEDFPEMFVIAGGSLMGFQLKNISFPVGRIQQIEMHPMAFDEFLLATNNDLLLQKIQDPIQQLSEFVEAKLYQELLNYFWVGGMPACVANFAEHKNYLLVREIQKDVIQTYIQDFAKYNPIVNMNCLLDIFKNIGTHVGSQIIYTKLSDRFSGAIIKKGVEVLTTANIIQPIQNVSIASLPFTDSGKQFKLVFVDIGL